MTGVSTAAQARNQVERLNSQQALLENLATQLATGKKTQKMSGLGNDLLTSSRARANLNSLEVYMNNITNADRRMQIMLQSVNEIQAQAENLSGSVLLLSKESVHQQGEEVMYDDPLTAEVENTRVGMTSADPSIELQTLTEYADNLYGVVMDLLNAQDGDSYLLSGSDTTTKPLEDTGLLDSAITGLITDWKNGVISNEELIADLTSGNTSNNPDAITDDIIGFSSDLSSGNVGDLTVRASDNLEVDYTVQANEDPFRDLVVGLAFLKNAALPPIADTYTDPSSYPGPPDAQGAPGDTLDKMKENFFDVFSSVSSMIENAINDIDSIDFRVETSRARINEVKNNHTETQSLLTDTVAEIEDVNLDEVAVKISALQVQLEATYAVTASVQQLSLVNFI